MGEPVTSRPIEELLPPEQVDLWRNDQQSKQLAPVVPASQVVTPMEMLNRALEKNADIGLLEKLMALQERWEANQAKKAFDAALASAKAAIPPIVRNAKGHNDKKYADFAAIAQVIDPILGANGLSYRFRTNQSDKIVVTCILSHKDGHAEETTLAGPADTTGNKNAIQAIGSTLTYLQRYTLVQMLGLAAAADDDGKKAGSGETITEDQEIELRDILLANDRDEKRFCKHIGVASLSDIFAVKFEDAKRIAAAAGARQ